MEKKLSLPRVINKGYEVLSDYGYGVGRTASLWASNVLMGGFLLMLDKSTRLGPNLWGTSVDAFVTSFSNAHGFLGLGRGPLKETVLTYQNNANLLISYNVIATGQAVFGTIFLFFLLLTLRNKFRMG